MTAEALAKLSISNERMEGLQPILNGSGHTHIKEVQCNYTWTVHGFSHCTEDPGQHFTSPTFSGGINDNYKWRILLYPKSDNQQYKNYLSLYLELLPYDEREVQAKFKFSILNKIGEKTNIKDATSTRFNKQTNWRNGWSTFILTDTLQKDELLPDNKLSIHCEIGIIQKFNIPNYSSTMQVVNSEYRMLDYITLIFGDEKFSDVTLFVAEKAFRAHKLVLAAQSPVFEAMFEHELQEKKHNRIEISDIDSDVILEMLRFMYTGKVKNLENIAIDLLVAADKYALERLKAMCEEVLCNNNNNPTVENAVKILIIADMHTANQLKAHSIGFITRHSKDVMETPDWISMARTRPHLLKELFGAVTR